MKKDRKYCTKKVLNGRVFDPDIVGQPGMQELVQIMEFQGWIHLFQLPMPLLYKDEVVEFYVDMMFTNDKETIMATVNKADFSIDVVVLGRMLGVPTEGVNTIVDKIASRNFLKLVGKLEGNLKGDRLFKK